VLVRYPEVNGSTTAGGLKVGSPQLLARLRLNDSSGAYEARSVIDGEWRTFSFHRIGHYPLYVRVGAVAPGLSDSLVQRGAVDCLVPGGDMPGGWRSLRAAAARLAQAGKRDRELTRYRGRTGGPRSAAAPQALVDAKQWPSRPRRRSRVPGQRSHESELRDGVSE